MTTDLDRINQRITELKGELADLETAARVLLNLPTSPENSKPRVSVKRRSVKRRSVKRRSVKRRSAAKRRRKIASKITIAGAAQIILSKMDGPAHYRDIAKEAVAMGYKGKITSTADKSEKAFWATMKRLPEIFESVGGGRFTLKD